MRDVAETILSNCLMDKKEQVRIVSA